MAYSMDLRVRVVAAHAECGSSGQVAEAFDVSESWVRRMSQLAREAGGDLSPKPPGRKLDQRAYDDADELAIRALIAAQPDATLAEVAAAIGKPACPGTVCRTLRRLGLPRKRSRRTRPSGTAPTS